MNKKRLILIFSFFYILLFQANAQLHYTVKENGSEYYRAMDLFNKEKYPAAIRLFDSYINKYSKSDVIPSSEAQYFAAVSALRLFNPDAEYRMLTYIYNNPESPRLNDARLELGNYFYQNKNYKKTVNYLESVNRQQLASDKLAEYFFRLGYSLYMTGNQDRALLMFSEIKDIDTEYTSPAVYYFSQIAYERKMYQTALEGFKRLKDDETFGSVVPFYIVQILYLQKDYNGILAVAPELLKSAGKTRSVELYRFIGDAYYNKENYKEALPYLEKYSEGAKASGREDKYQLGYCYYKAGDYDKAIKLLLEIDAKSDPLSQNVWYVLGDCYLHKGDKQRSRLAFGQASLLNYDRNIKEDALFNYAKLTYETAYAPFGEAITAFQDYIDQYPGSKKIQEVYDYLVGTFMQIKNYKAALAALDKIGNKDNRLEEAYQKVAFFRGLELFNNMDIEASVAMFDKSLKYEKYNRQIRARAVYWRGEANYRLGHFDLAKSDYELFMGLPGSSGLPENNLLRYNLGYSYYNLKDYNTALSNFKSFETGNRDVKPDIIADSRTRIGDCYFIATDYKSAIIYYDEVIEYGSIDADYAMFQKGFCLGLINDTRGKIDILSSLLQKYPSSTYVPAAIFERGRAHLVLEDYKKGEADFNTIISAYPASSYVPRSMVQLGLLYYNLGDNEKAVNQYKKVIENFKSSPESRDAMTGLKNSYVEMNDVDSYFSYVKAQGGSEDVNMNQKDSLLYNSGENLFMSGKFDKATDVLKNYINEFPDGSFRFNAEYYLAECFKTAGNNDEALKYYKDVADQPGCQFQEQALVEASSILYSKEEYAEALVYYEKLEKETTDAENSMTALKGELMTAYKTGDAQKTINAAGKLISFPKVPQEAVREAIFMRAKANYSLNNFDEALKDFRKTSTEVTSIEGAESKYRVAEILYKKDRVDESDKEINEFIDQKSPHQFWMAKVFLLLADISIKKGDNLQARATLQSLKDYYSVKDDGILDEVQTRLNSLGENKNDTEKSETAPENNDQQN